MDAAGDTASMPDDLSTEPRINAQAAGMKAAEHLASTGSGESSRDALHQDMQLPTIDIKDFQAEVVAGFPLPSRPTVLNKGPFENPIPEDRVLVIYGSGHAKLLTEFAEDSGAFVVERPSAYLTPKS